MHFQIQYVYIMKKVFLVFIAVLFVSYGFAQEELPTVVPERPGYTWGAEVTPHHKIIWDQGIGYESTPEGENTMTLSSTVLRYGLFENMELRVGTDFIMYNKGEAIAPFTGVNPLTIGTKIKLYDGSGILPAVGLLAEEFQEVPLGSCCLQHFFRVNPHLVEYDGEFVHECNVDIPLAVLYYFRGFGNLNGRCSMNTSFNDQLGAFVDTYNYLNSEEGNQYMLETGLFWQVSRRVQLDIESDFDVQNFGKYYAVGCGVSWMIN